MKQRVVVIGGGVIGGGVIGAAVAWHLLDRGVSDVTLLERDRPGARGDGAAVPEPGDPVHRERRVLLAPEPEAHRRGGLGAPFGAGH